MEANEFVALILAVACLALICLCLYENGKRAKAERELSAIKGRIVEARRWLTEYYEASDTIAWIENSPVHANGALVMLPIQDFRQWLAKRYNKPLTTVVPMSKRASSSSRFDEADPLGIGAADAFSPGQYPFGEPERPDEPIYFGRTAAPQRKG